MPADWGRARARERMKAAAETCAALILLAHLGPPPEHDEETCKRTCAMLDWARLIFAHWTEPQIGNDDLTTAILILRAADRSSVWA